MADVPETCPFCGAPKSPTSDIPELDYLGWECGASLEGLNIPDDIYREPECFIRELRPKAEAMDRLEEMVRHKCGDSTSQVEIIDDEDDGLSVLVDKASDPKFYHILGTGEDLASAINAAFAQWKESK